MRRRRPALVTAVAIVGTLAAGCGKKGPPLAPIVRIPAGVDKIEATRMGNDVFVTVTIPTTNIDKTLPADLGRIDIFGYTGRTPPARARWAELGQVVASIDVPPPPEPGLVPSPAAAPTAVLPGGVVTVRDVLTADELEQGPLPPVDPRQREVAPILGPVGPPPPLRRFYMAVPFSTRERNGPPGAQAELVLTPIPDAPSALRVTYNAARVALTWEPAGGLFGFLLDRALPPEPTPFIPAQPTLPLGVGVGVGVVQRVAEVTLPTGPTTYNVYREVAPDPLAFAPAAARVAVGTPPPTPMNEKPLDTTTTADAEVTFGRQRCYVVRAQRGAVMSEPSPPACLTPVDIFPPAAPSGLAAVASEGGITLIWEPNGEADLTGYLVLRREPGNATLRQLNEIPVRDARYRDTTIRSGARYIYSVVAVDAQLPLPNVSMESERVEETAP